MSIQATSHAVLHNNILDIRRKNLRALMDTHGTSKLAEMLGMNQPSFLSQMAGPAPTRMITEKTVRKYESALNLAPGTLDKPQTAEAPAQSAADMVTLVLNATRMVGQVCEIEAVNLPTSKFAEVVALIIEDTIGHGGVMREDHVKRVVRLFK